MTRYRVRVELIEVYTNEESGKTAEATLDASDGQLQSSLTTTQELFYSAIEGGAPKTRTRGPSARRLARLLDPFAD